MITKGVNHEALKQKSLTVFHYSRFGYATADPRGG
jgi:hypothetical protein